MQLRRGHELGSKNPNWRYPSLQLIKSCERLVEVDGKLLAILNGQIEPANTAERLALAELCQLPCRKHFAAAYRFYCEAFAAEPKLAEDLNLQHRYKAACAAALAGCGHGKDAEGLHEKKRLALRRQALDWLRADLAAYERLLGKDSNKAGSLVRQRMQHWRQDTDFAGVRGADAIARLPEAERPEWQKLWQRVETMHKVRP